MDNLLNNLELLKLVEEDIEKVVGGKMDVRTGAARILATALSTLTVAGGVSTHASTNGGDFVLPATNQDTQVDNTDASQNLALQRILEKPSLFNHFNNFTVHDDNFWNEDITNLGELVQLAQELLISSRNIEKLRALQGALNFALRGNYRFSEKMLYHIARHIDERIGEQRPLKRSGILLTIRDFCMGAKTYTPARNARQPFIPHIPGMALSGVWFDFPEDFLNLPQVQQEFNTQGVLRNIPYDSMLAYLSGIHYMAAFVDYVKLNATLHLPSKVGVGFQSPQFKRSLDNFYRSQNIEELRTNFLELLSIFKNLFHDGAIANLVFSFNNYIEEKDISR